MRQKAGCLVIHGFGGSIREVKPLVEALESKGYVTRCPALKGHTGVRADLREVSWQDWVRSAEEELVCLMNSCEQVFIAGFSMGGLIGMQLAKEYPVSGLITINTPVYYWDFPRIISNILRDIRTGDYSNIRRYLKPSNRLPLNALWNFRQLLKSTKKLMPRLTIPMMIVQAIDDDVVQHRSAGYIYRHSGSLIKQLSTYSRGGHVILLTEICDSVLTDIYRFLQDQTDLSEPELIRA